MSVYDYSVKTQQGGEESLAEYKGKVLLIVNTATGCGFTPQYKDLEALYKDHEKDGLVILDFPSNQFLDQAPGTDEEIHEFCTLKYGTTFPQYHKIDVRGETADPLFRYLADNTEFKGFGSGPKALLMKGMAKKMDKNYKDNGDVKWNFTKFLIDRDGNIVERFEPTVPMETVRKSVEALL